MDYGSSNGTREARPSAKVAIRSGRSASLDVVRSGWTSWPYGGASGRIPVELTRGLWRSGQAPGRRHGIRGAPESVCTFRISVSRVRLCPSEPRRPSGHGPAPDTHRDRGRIGQQCTPAKRDNPRGRLDRCGHSERDPVRKREIAPSRRFPAVVCVTLGKRRPHDRHFIRREAPAKANKHDLGGPDVVLVRLNCAYLAAINTWRLCVENRPRVLGFCFVLVGSATTKPGF
jgi:hypothetical protein